MGARKQKAANLRKETLKSTYFAKLNNCPTSPRKMRMVADMIRGVEVARASALLQFTKREAAGRLNKLLRAAIDSYEHKSGETFNAGDLIVKEVFVDEGRSLKRVQPAPQGRAHRIRKRSNHVTIILGTN